AQPAGAMRASDPRLKETDELFTRESNRKTKLLRDAVRHGHEGVQKALSLAGAPIAGDSTAIRTLVENGVDPLIPDYDKRTAL
ncbi:hypothetical protein T484DRAFT_1793337, partial [Baffinella frigidus]